MSYAETCNTLSDGIALKFVLIREIRANVFVFVR